MMTIALVAALASAEPTASNPAGPWGEIAKSDIDAIRTLLRDNHPGLVDPDNHTYAERFQVNYPKALALAAKAGTFFDYKRAVLAYTNGFRDGHTVVLFQVDATSYRWPGFTATSDEQGTYSIAEAEGEAAVASGDELLSCDGYSIDHLMRERIDPYFWNADIPHERSSHIGKLFVIDASDESSKMKSCRIRTGTGERDIPLAWRSLANTRAEALRGKHFYEGEPALTKVGDTWLIRLPSFMFQTPQQVKQIRHVLSEIAVNSDEIRRSKVVLDVRGNAGGSSSWGSEIAKQLWGEPLVSHVESSFDWTADWRASPANLKRVDETIQRLERDGIGAEYQRKVRRLIAAALSEGKPLARVPAEATSKGKPPPPSRFAGRAYLLTDGVCASACLDFADIVRRMPNTTHIGWPTSADTVYVENTLVPLPSGLGLFTYSMKANRKRSRGNNEWYEPQIRWPGGPATDAAVAVWISGLK
jgi:hypothetical protein